MPHLRSDTIEKYALQKLGRSWIARAEEHLLICTSCRDRLDGFEAAIQVIRAVSAWDVRPAASSAGWG
jgi:hypothetical protein